MNKQIRPSEDETQVIGGSLHPKANWSQLYKKVMLVVLLLVGLAIAGAVVYLKQDADSGAFVKCANSGGKVAVAGKVVTCTDKSGNKSQAANNNVESESWKLFDGKLAAVQYPAGWSISETDTSRVFKNTSSINFTPPADSTVVVDSANSSEYKLVSSLLINPSTKINRKITAKVLASKEFVFLPSAKRAQLLALDTNGNQKADLLTIGTVSVKVGDTSVTGFFDFDKKYQLALQGSIANNKSNDDPSKSQIYDASDAADLLDSKTVSSLILILSGIQLK